MRRAFGRSGRGHSRVFVQRVRHTAHTLRHCGAPSATVGHKTQEPLDQAPVRRATRPQRRRLARTAAMRHHEDMRTPSTRRTPGQKLRHGPLVQASDRTMAPIRKGQSTCPAQCGRTPGIASAPATGFLCATRVPTGQPRAPSAVLPVLAQGQGAIGRVQSGPKRQRHAGAGDVGVNAPGFRQALHARGMLTGGIPTPIEPTPVAPRAQDVLARRKAAGVHRLRTPHQVPVACASGDSRPGVDSHSASWLSRGAGQVRDKGPPGAVRQQGMTVMAHHGATLGRLQQQQRSTRAQKFRRLLG